jgi:hypothetical protein
MIWAAFILDAGFGDSSDTPKSYKEMLEHKNQSG